MGMSSRSLIRIAHHRRIPGGETTGASGNSNGGATIADGAGKIGALGISRVEVVGDTCLSGISVYDFELSKHRKGETIGAIYTGGGELFDGSASDDECVSSSSTPTGEATTATSTFGATGFISNHNNACNAEEKYRWGKI
uniref:Uncharacterized protein n=1 Tax=Tanacetum cinerariifolium TaxID=118510 RepID=A0A699HPC4_TANCI|nr:hypothetical protein [Tanacetum cinerariifolium]